MTVPQGITKVTFKLTFLKLLNGPVDCRVSDGNDFITVNVLANNDIQEVTVEKEISSRNITLVLIFRSANITAYVDNIRFTAQ